MKTNIYNIATLVAYIAMVGVNYLAVLLPLGGRDTGEIADNYFNLFTPAGYAFSIWGLIYLSLAVYVVYQIRRNKDKLVAQINRVFLVNAIFNASWLFAWHYDLIWLSALIIVGMLITLIKIADIIKANTLSKKERWLVCLPFSLYFGWITVATIANITVLLVSLGWNGFGLSESVWTVIVLLVGALIGSWRMLSDRFVPYGLVLMWAYGAILVKHISEDGFDAQYPSIIWTTVTCLFIFLGTIIFISTQKKKKSRA